MQLPLSVAAQRKGKDVVQSQGLFHVGRHWMCVIGFVLLRPGMRTMKNCILLCCFTSSDIPAVSLTTFVLRILTLDPPATSRVEECQSARFGWSKPLS